MDFVLMYPIILKYSYKYIKVLIVPRSGYFVYLFLCCLLRRRSSMLCISSPLLRTESPLLRPLGFFLPSFLSKKLTTGRAESATRYDAGPNGSVHGTKGERALRVAQGVDCFRVLKLSIWTIRNFKMVKNIVLEAPKAPQSKPPFSCSSCLIFLQVEVLEPSKRFRCFSFLLLVKKYRDKLCLGTFVIVRYWLMQVCKPCSCVLRRK